MTARKTKRGNVFCVDKETDIVQARIIMVEQKVRHLPVVDDQGRLIGMVSDRDLRTAMPLESYQHPEIEQAKTTLSRVQIAEIMTRAPHRISAGYTLQDTLMLFKKTKVGAFPIVDEHDVVVGIISDRDLLDEFIDLLGVGSPGCFLGLLLPPSPRFVSRIVSAFAEEKIAISSMLVLQDWKEDNHALFIYLLTQNIRHAKDLITEMGYPLIDPMEWFFYRHTTDDRE